MQGGAAVCPALAMRGIPEGAAVLRLRQPTRTGCPHSLSRDAAYGLSPLAPAAVNKFAALPHHF